jgi:hypothetical protein
MSREYYARNQSDFRPMNSSLYEFESSQAPPNVSHPRALLPDEHCCMLTLL